MKRDYMTSKYDHCNIIRFGFRATCVNVGNNPSGDGQRVVAHCQMPNIRQLVCFCVTVARLFLTRPCLWRNGTHPICAAFWTCSGLNHGHCMGHRFI